MKKDLSAIAQHPNLALPGNHGGDILSPMSVVEIIRELPRLTAVERAAVQRELRELEKTDEAQFLHEAADSMFQDLDKEEATDARRKAR